MISAVSAGIQKLEEELGASIESEDVSSMGTLSEKHGLDHESQTSEHQLVARQQSTDQNTKEDISQVDKPADACGTTSELRSSDDQSEDRTDTTLDIACAKTEKVEINEDYHEPKNAFAEKTESFKSHDTDSGSLRDEPSVQKDKDINGTVDTDEISGTIDPSDVIKLVDTSDTWSTVDTSGPGGTTLDPLDTSGTVDTSNISLTLSRSDTSTTVDTSDVTRSLDSSADTSGTVDTNDITDTEQEIR